MIGDIAREGNFGVYIHKHNKWKTPHEVLTKMAEESPRCVMMGIYENDTGQICTHITDGTILDPEAFSSFVAQVHSAAEETISLRLGKGVINCQHLNLINHVIVETEKFTMISRRIGKNLSLLFVLRAPVECLGMWIELIDRWKDKLIEAVSDSGTLPVS